MTVSKLFLNGCSFLTFRPKQGVDTHCGVELAKKMDLEIAVNLAGGGRGNKRTSFTTKVWCEKYPDIAEKCFFLIGSSSGTRVDYPTSDGYKRHKFPSMATTWRTYSPNKDPECTHTGSPNGPQGPGLGPSGLAWALLGPSSSCPFLLLLPSRS